MGLGKKKILSQGASGIVGTDNFNTVLYTGNGGTQSIDVGFKPDLVWVKTRSLQSSHVLRSTGMDSTYTLASNSTAALNTAQLTGGRLQLDSNGFTVRDISNNGYGTNGSNETQVAWCWKGGGAPTATNSAGAGNSPTSGSVMIDGSSSSAALAGNVEAKKMSVNTAAQFSIVKFTSQAGATNQVPHGLNGVPDLFIFKRTDSTGSWWTYTQVVDGSLDYFALNSGDAKSDSSETAPTSTTVYQPTSSSGRDYILYSFKNVAGYQKIGTYTGSGVSGKSVTTGFQPRFLLIKAINFGSGYWFILDNQRTSGTNGKIALWANDSLAESGNSYDVRFDATGFTLLNTDSHLNQNYDYLYLAIA